MDKRLNRLRFILNVLDELQPGDYGVPSDFVLVKTRQEMHMLQQQMLGFVDRILKKTVLTDESFEKDKAKIFGIDERIDPIYQTVSKFPPPTYAMHTVTMDNTVRSRHYAGRASNTFHLRSSNNQRHIAHTSVF